MPRRPRVERSFQYPFDVDGVFVGGGVIVLVVVGFWEGEFIELSEDLVPRRCPRGVTRVGHVCCSGGTAALSVSGGGRSRASAAAAAVRVLIFSLATTALACWYGGGGGGVLVGERCGGGGGGGGGGGVYRCIDLLGRE